MRTLHWLKTRICSWWKDSPLVFLLLSLLVGLLLVFLVIAFSEDPEWVFCLFGIGDKFQILKFLGVAMGGVLLAIQAVAAQKRVKAMEETAKNTEKGLRQERLKNAMEYMGNASDSVRLGGVYELFHLAEDNEELRGTVLDVLCAHVRRTTRGAAYQNECPTKPSEEIQSLLTLLFVQEHDVFAGLRIHLAGSWLNGANLQNARLQKANLQGTQLQGAHLIGTRLQGVNLWKAQLQGVNLWYAHLQGADLQGARLQGAVLWGAWLHGANLENAQLQGADLGDARLHGAVSAGSWPDGFAERMEILIGRKSDICRVIFSGGLMMKDMDSILEGLSDEKAEELRERLEPHRCQQTSHELPEGSGAQTGAYTSEEAEAWIKEYEEAIS